MTTDAAVLETQASAPVETQPAAVTESDDAELSSALEEYKGIGKGARGPDSQDAAGTDSPAPGTDSPPAVDDPQEADAVEAIRQAAIEEGKQIGATETQAQLDERQKRDQINRTLQGTRQVFDTYAPAIRGHLAAVQRGEIDLDVDGVLNAVTAIAGASGPAASLAFLSAVHEFSDDLLDADGAKRFKAENDAAVMHDKGWRHLFNNLKASMQDHARKGYIKAEDKELVEARVYLATKKDLLAHPEKFERWQQQAAGGAASRPNVTGGNGTPKEVTYSQILKMSEKQINALPSDVFEKAISGG